MPFAPTLSLRQYLMVPPSDPLPRFVVQVGCASAVILFSVAWQERVLG
jgi:hypothetical protein